MKKNYMSMVTVWVGLALAAIAADGRSDVTAKVSEAVKDNALSIAASNGNFGDPDPGAAKRLVVEYQLGDMTGKKVADENAVLEIQGPTGRKLTILKAVYGAEQEGDADGPAAMVYGETRVFRPAARWLDDGGVPVSGHSAGMLFHDQVYYWYGENRTPGKDGGVRCYSSVNLHDWKNEGIAFAVSEDPSNIVARGCIIERPKVLFNKQTAKFVMWFHHELKGVGYDSARVGVAVADHPAGPFMFIESFKPNGQDSRDQTLFLDDDGKAYHICSSEGNGTLHITQLTEDFLKPAGPFTRAFPGRSYEAPAVFKHQGKYYLIASGCTGWAPNAARSAVADSILGPWTELGNPWRGPEEQLKTSFNSQSTYVLPVQGRADALIFMADRWKPNKLHDSRMIWLPVEWEDDKPVLHWVDEWNLNLFDKKQPSGPYFPI
jgi:hypothetical protein